MSAKRERPRSVVLERGIRRIWLPSKTGWIERIQVQLARGETRRAQLCKTFEEARAIKTDWLERGIPSKGAPDVPADTEITATFDDALRQRVLDLETRGKDAAVTERVRDFLKRQWPAGAAMPLNLVTLDHIREYRQRREQAGCAASTITREIRELRSTMKRAVPGFKVPEELLPVENLIRVRTMNRATYDKVFARLRKQSGPVLADMADLALLAVMRLSEVRELKREYVNLPARKLELPTTKGGKPRAVALCSDAVRILKRALGHHPDSPLVFPNPQGRPYSRVHVSRCWKRAARSIGLRDFTFHDLRHVKPTEAANDGASDAILQRMGGWRSVKMVRRYSDVGDPALRRYLGPPK